MRKSTLRSTRLSMRFSTRRPICLLPNTEKPHGIKLFSGPYIRILDRYMVNGKKEKFNNRWTSIPPEEIIAGRTYSFSFNPSDQPTRGDKSGPIKDDFLKNYDTEFVNLFKRLKYCEIELYAELSQLGRLHYHGWISITDIARFYMFEIHKLMFHGSFEIDHLFDERKWFLYVTKQTHLMKPFCDDYGIHYMLQTSNHKREVRAKHKLPKKLES